MDLREHFAVLCKRWISVVALTIIGVALAVFLTAQTPKSLTATAQDFVAITAAGSTGGGTGEALASAQFAQFRVKSYTLVVTSPNLTEPVVRELNLP